MKKLIVALSIFASANTFAYTANIHNQSKLDLVVKSNGQTICNIAAESSVTCGNLDAYTVYAVNYKLSTSEQGLFTLQKASYQVLQTTPVSPTPVLANYMINYQATSDVNSYTGSVNNFSGATSGSCFSDTGGVTCRLSDGDNLQQLNITASSNFTPAPTPAPATDPIKTASGIYVSANSEWESGTLYTPTWDNSVNAEVYPEVSYNSQSYIACSTINSSIENLTPAQVFAQQSWGPWLPFNNNQTKNPCTQAIAKAATSGTRVKFW